MTDRAGIFGGDDPFGLIRAWMGEAEKTEPNDPNAMAVATVDADGLPNVRILLLKEVEDNGLVFYTNYTSAKAGELDSAGKVAIVLHWKSLRRQIRARGHVEKVEGAQADAYFATRSAASRTGAWASNQSQPIENRAMLEAQVAAATEAQGPDPKRPPHWGGYRLVPTEIEFWADGAARLHDRFLWSRENGTDDWRVTRLQP